MIAPRGKLCSVLLVVSLAANLFLGGVLAGRWFRPAPASFEPGAFSMNRMRRALGPEARPAVDRVWARHQADIADRMRTAAEARDRATQSLRADPFNPAKAAADLAEFRARAAEVQQAMHGAVIELAADLTPEQRRRLASAVDRAGPGRRRGGRWMGPNERNDDAWDRPAMPGSAPLPGPSESR